MRSGSTVALADGSGTIQTEVQLRAVCGHDDQRRINVQCVGIHRAGVDGLGCTSIALGPTIRGCSASSARIHSPSGRINFYSYVGNKPTLYHPIRRDWRSCAAGPSTCLDCGKRGLSIVSLSFRMARPSAVTIVTGGYVRRRTHPTTNVRRTRRTAHRYLGMSPTFARRGITYRRTIGSMGGMARAMESRQKCWTAPALPYTMPSGAISTGPIPPVIVISDDAWRGGRFSRDGSKRCTTHEELT